jgi:hypothetical protein
MSVIFVISRGALVLFAAQDLLYVATSKVTAEIQNDYRYNKTKYSIRYKLARTKQRG